MMRLGLFFYPLSVRLTKGNVLLNIIWKVVLNAYKTMGYSYSNIHYRNFGVTETPRLFKGLGVFFLGVVVSLTAGTPNTSASEVNLQVISQIESSGRASAINKKDHNGLGTRGLFQIGEGLRADYNRLNKAKVSPSDLFNPEVNTKVAVWAFNVYYPLLLTKTMKRPVTVRNLLICHNAGCGKVNNPPKHTSQFYIPKYQRLGGTL